MVFDTGSDLWRAALVGIVAYVAIVVAVRIGGKRTLAKLNAFDLLVTVALGSTLSSIALSDSVSIAEGVIAFAVLCGAQFVVAWTSVRSGAVRKIVKARPVVVLEDGRLLEGVCRRERLTPGEVHQAVRASGIGDLHQVAAVVLETDGSTSVIPRSALGSGSALEDVAHMQDAS